MPIKTQIKIRTSVHSIADNVQLVFKSEVDDGEIKDTQVFLEDKEICWIAGSDILRFVEEITQVIDSYSI